jgi:hypothetical protein
MSDQPRSSILPLEPLAALWAGTFKQLVRDPALVLVTAASLLLIVSAPAYAVFHFDELSKVMIDTGLSTALLAGLLVALLGPARAVAYELEDRTALTLLSKPVGRLTLIVGKYAGVVAAAAAALAPLVLAVLYVVRITEMLAEEEEAEAVSGAVHGMPEGLGLLLAVGAVGLVLTGVAVWRCRRARVAAGYAGVLATALAGIVAGALGGGGGAWRWGVLGAGLLIGLEVAVVAAIAMAAAVRLGAVGTLGVGLGAVVAGHMPWREWMGAAGGPALGALALVVPDLERLNMLAAAAGGAPIPALYVAWAGLYATMYAFAALLVGAALMHGREVA